KDSAAAFRWARLAFDTGLPAGKHVLGRCLANGIGVTLNERAGLKLIHDAAVCATPFPISLLQLHEELRDEGKDSEAIQAANAALRQGVDQAAVLLGYYRLGMTRTGRNLARVTSNPNAAIEILKPAAAKGNADAQFLLAHAYAWNREKAGLAK